MTVVGGKHGPDIQKMIGKAILDAQDRNSMSTIQLKTLDDPVSQMARFETADTETTIMKPIDLNEIIKRDARNNISFKDSPALDLIRQAGLPIDEIVS